MSIYLATPIDHVTVEQRERIRGAVHEVYAELMSYGLSVYDPSKAWRYGGHSDTSIQRVNLEALRSSEGVVVVWPNDVMSTGCGIEVGIAAQMGLPVAVLREGYSVALDSMPTVRQVDTPAAAAVWVSVQSRQEVRWSGTGHEPTRAYSDDAGFDLFCDVETSIGVGECCNVPSDVAMEWPNGWWGLLLGRSSTFKDRGLIVNPGVIDNGYRGPLFATVRNISGQVQVVRYRERIAQIIPLPTLGAGFPVRQVERLSDSERGEGGFGSTGA